MKNLSALVDGATMGDLTSLEGLVRVIILQMMFLYFFKTKIKKKYSCTWLLKICKHVNMS